MAKRKKHRVSGVKRRRSHARGMGAIDFTSIGSIVGGAVLAGYINKLVPATVNDKILAGGKVALGVALPMMFKSGKSKNIMAGIGAGFIAVGSVDLLKSFGALSGDFDIPVINGLGEDVLNGDSDIPVINGNLLEENNPFGEGMGEDVLSGEEEAMGESFMYGDDED